jgi:hypothetical protein
MLNGDPINRADIYQVYALVCNMRGVRYNLNIVI